ncbi:hypothetical protein Cgig2_013359 [Carnegiea gigantea]|uniref:Uncharacterized protein n=1 Tax=Carnegiea gigantea TaxID=171969 RepID=A0A9Q1GRZ6_9CARY|nr:hypothetical protein Cgig2_013359 [Carnegiea gigantea]
MAGFPRRNSMLMAPIRSYVRSKELRFNKIFVHQQVLEGIDFDIEARNGQFWNVLARALQAHSTPQRSFYNNTPCQYANDNANNLLSSWNTWTSVNAGQTFVGIPAAPAAATSRYIPPDALRTKVLPQIKASAKYGESCFGLGSTTMGTVTPSRVIYRASSAN